LGVLRVLQTFLAKIFFWGFSVESGIFGLVVKRLTENNRLVFKGGLLAYALTLPKIQLFHLLL
jgi:hypothetical protein